MKKYTIATDVLSAIKKYKNHGLTIGFVPTMGALHEGHLSLVRRSKVENDFTVVSIFINPTQFNNPEDLKNYPRTMESDLQMLSESGCDMVFTPSVEEMYPENDLRTFDFGHLDKIMEGLHRPGHFNGVAQIVSKLFEIVPATKAYFGQKDFQQLAIIKKLVAQLNLDIQICPCPIIREVDGLAMSSRNKLLTAEHRSASVLISKTLANISKQKTSMNIEQLKNWVVSTVNESDLLQTEYFEIVDDTDLFQIKNWDDNKKMIACIAVIAGKVRLIDNAFV